MSIWTRLGWHFIIKQSCISFLHAYQHSTGNILAKMSFGYFSYLFPRCWNCNLSPIMVITKNVVVLSFYYCNSFLFFKLTLPNFYYSLDSADSFNQILWSFDIVIFIITRRFIGKGHLHFKIQFLNKSEHFSLENYPFLNPDNFIFPFLDLCFPTSIKSQRNYYWQNPWIIHTFKGLRKVVPNWFTIKKEAKKGTLISNFFSIIHFPDSLETKWL